MDCFASLKLDDDVFSQIVLEKNRQENFIQLIASENTAWPEVLEAQGTILTNKYAEGYPGRRYYGGCEVVDTIESIAIDRLKKLFKCEYANVQPYSGSTANMAVFLAFLKPGDTILGMGLDSGGHLTHGGKMSISGKFFNAVGYGVDAMTGLIDYDDVQRIALECKPKLIIAGFSAYSRNLDWKRFKEIADKVNAILMCDIAHIAGLIAGEVLESPVAFADVITSTTHKTLRGPRGGIIFAKDTRYAKAIDSAVFPGLQGGPLMHVIAAKAVAFKCASNVEFKVYAQSVVNNAQVLADVFINRGLVVLTGGTDCHLMIIDLRHFGINGMEARELLHSAGIVCNQNGIPKDPLPPMKSSGIRIGTPAGTTRGFGTNEFAHIGNYIADLLFSAKDSGLDSDFTKKKAHDVRLATLEMCKKFPIYPHVSYS